MESTRTILLAVATVLVLVPTLAVANSASDVGFRGWGPRVGVSLDPDLVHFGAHLDFGQLANRVRFQPNAEFGFGDDTKLFTFSAEATYWFRERWKVWEPYFGGDVGVHIENVGNKSHTDIGLSVLGGFEKEIANGDRFFVETKISLNDAPETKVTVGWTFYH